jgi:hypothetical protein
MVLLILCLLIANLTFTASEPLGNKVMGPVFPKILWTYWDSNLANAPIMTQICINNMIHFAAVSGWEFRLTTSSNLNDFLSEESQTTFKKITENIDVPLPNLSDIIRTFLLHDNGGMWVDATTLFVRDLGWIERIKENNLVYNKVS